MNAVDQYLFETSKPVGEFIGRLLGRTPIDSARPVSGFAFLMVFVGLSLNADLNIDYSGMIVGAFVGGIWVVSFHFQHKLFKQIQNAVEAEKISFDYLDVAFSQFGFSRKTLIILVAFEFLLGIFFSNPGALLTGMGYAMLLLAEYMLCNWTPPKKSLKESVKESVSKMFLKPSPIEK